jgi:hypothetical protein
MGELITGVMAGLVVSILNRFVINGTFWKMCDGRQHVEDDDDDGNSSESSAIISDIHVQH